MITGMIADGESQSASRMVTYIDAIQPLSKLYDGFFVHSRGGTGAALCSGVGCSLGTPPGNSKIRTDQVPVLVFETETDTVGHFNARQPDGINYRLWEPAGTAHADRYDSSYITQNQANQVASNPPVVGGYPAIVCTFPYNAANEHYVVNSAIWHLSQWINGGTPPPSAPAPITVVGAVIQRDMYYIALGGIRLPEMDVPTQTHQGLGNLQVCFVASSAARFRSAANASAARKPPAQCASRMRMRARRHLPVRAAQLTAAALPTITSPNTRTPRTVRWRPASSFRGRDRGNRGSTGELPGLAGRNPVRRRQCLHADRHLPGWRLYGLEPHCLHGFGPVPHRRYMCPRDRTMLEPGCPERDRLQRRQRLYADRRVHERHAAARTPAPRTKTSARTTGGDPSSQQPDSHSRTRVTA